MRSLIIILIAAIVVAAIILPQIFFVVDEKKVAIVTRFGEIQREVKSPGLNVKAPFLDNVTYFEKRLLNFDAPPDSLLTKDKKRLIIDVYARGRIVNPTLFRERLGDEVTAAARAAEIVTSELRREIASHDQSEIITTQRDLMLSNVLASVKPKLAEFGIDVIDVRIKRADFPGEIAESVYSRMQAERKRKADKERAEGAEIDAQVRADADRKATIILANAERDSSIIRGCGEAQATAVFAQALEQDPDFYTFQRSLESFKAILAQGTTVVLPLSGFGQLFEEMRGGVDTATVVEASREVGLRDELLGQKCAEVSAAWTLAAELKIDQPDLEFVSIVDKVWPDNSLGCSAIGSGSVQEIPGFEVVFSYSNEAHVVRTNQYGSLVKTEKFC
ncbi:MAG: protease modulator HflC [SAR202 cluster bacterium]|nr:protease modulator HflC [SAR202 cluster bacterium]|tara:strand:- start:715 stop:1884 length:1170 start_codon:yes stop_codon:yes gene_type:complete